MTEKTFNMYQAKNGSIMLSIGNIRFKLEKEIAEKLDLYDIEDFSAEDFNKFYNQKQNGDDKWT